MQAASSAEERALLSGALSQLDTGCHKVMPARDTGAHLVWCTAVLVRLG